MTATITDEAVAAKARELHDEGCPAPCAFGITSTWLHYARAVLEHEARQAEADRDRDRVRSEVRDRLDAAGDVAELAALRWLAHERPDIVNEALDAVGAPS